MKYIIEATKLFDTWYVELPTGYKGYVTTKNLQAILKNLAKRIEGK